MGRFDKGGFLAHRNHQVVEMRQKPGIKGSHGEKVVKDIRRATRKQYSAEEGVLVGYVPEGVDQPVDGLISPRIGDYAAV